MSKNIQTGTQYLSQIEQSIDPIAKALNQGITAAGTANNNYSSVTWNTYSAYMQALANSASSPTQNIINWSGTYNASLTTSASWAGVVGSGVGIVTPNVSIANQYQGLSIPAALISNLTNLLNTLLSPVLVMNGLGKTVAPRYLSGGPFYSFAEIAQLQAKGQTGQLYGSPIGGMTTASVEGYIINPSTTPIYQESGGPLFTFTAANLPSSAQMNELVNLSSTIYLSTPV